MNVQVSDRWKITGATMNLVLWENQTVTRGKNKGTSKWIKRGYYPNLQALIRRIIEYDLWNSDIKLLEEITQCIEKSVSSIISYLNKGVV